MQASTRRTAVSVAFCLPVVAAIAFLFLTAPTFEATAVVTLAPGEDPTESMIAAEQRPAIVATEVEAAESRELRASLDDIVAFDHEYVVRGDPEAATLRLTASAGSSAEALTAAETAVALFVGRRAELPSPDGAPTASVAEPATLPDEPVSPQFIPVLAAGLAAGILLAGVVVAATRRAGGSAEGTAGPPEAATAPVVPRRPNAAQAAMAAVAIVGTSGLAVAAFAGLHELWEVRTTTDHQVEASIACIPRWLDEVPDGASIYPQPDPPEIRSDFWLARLSELAFPRLDVATTPATADYQVKIVLIGEGGKLPCAGYEVIVTPS